jgi:ATP-dependent protease ClpP protease subunit
MNPQIRLRLANKDRGQFRAQDNTIWLYDAIASDEEEAYWMGGVSPQSFIAALRSMDGPVTLRINSPGGSVWGAQAMVAAMREYPHAITAKVDSIAASAASVIAVECASVEMVAGSYLMIHKAWGLVIGNADDLLDTAALLEKLDGGLADSYAARAGDKDRKKWMALMSAETWFSGAEAVEAGLADLVIEDSTQRPQAKWDLAAFNRAPEGVAAEAAPDTSKKITPELEDLIRNIAGQAGREVAEQVIQNEQRSRREREVSVRLAANRI